MAAWACRGRDRPVGGARARDARRRCRGSRRRGAPRPTRSARRRPAPSGGQARRLRRCRRRAPSVLELDARCARSASASAVGVAEVEASGAFGAPAPSSLRMWPRGRARGRRRSARTRAARRSARRACAAPRRRRRPGGPRRSGRSAGSRRPASRRARTPSSAATTASAAPPAAERSAARTSDPRVSRRSATAAPRVGCLGRRRVAQPHRPPLAAALVRLPALGVRDRARSSAYAVLRRGVVVGSVRRAALEAPRPATTRSSSPVAVAVARNARRPPRRATS